MDWQQQINCFIFDQLDSTHKQAYRYLSHSPFWIMAYCQTKAIGRRKRVWITPRGNFAATYCNKITTTLQHCALNNFVAALALYDTCVDFGVDPNNLALKWPNDVLYKGGKMAGILLETTGTNPCYLLISFGVNLAVAPIDALQTKPDYPIKSLKQDAKIIITPDAFLQRLAVVFAQYEKLFQSQGFDIIRVLWLKRAAGLGQNITVCGTDKPLEGYFDNIDDRGSLILLTANGRRLIHAGDIFFI